MGRNTKKILLSSVGLIGLAPLVGHADEPISVQQAVQQTAQVQSPGAGARDAQAEAEQIIVTGTARAGGLKKLDASYSITSISDEQIKQAAPSSTADLLKVVPGVFAESSSGESGPNIEVRGFPGNSDAPFVTYLINGAPIYPASTLSFMDNSSLIRLDDMIERQEVELGGTAAIFNTGQPGATINLIQKTGLTDPDGSIRVTYGSDNLYRTDVYYGGKIADDWYGAIGGFYRTEDGVRDTQFPEADGGAIHANLTHTFEGGQVTFYANETKDDDAFFVGIPLAVTGGPGTGQPINFSSLPNFNALTGTLLGNAWRDVDIPNLPGSSLSRNLADGRGVDLHSFSFNFDKKFGDGWNVTDVGGYNGGTTTCNCAFNVGNYIEGTQGGNAIGTLGALVGTSLPGLPTGVKVASVNGTLLNSGAAVGPNQQITSAEVWTVSKTVSSFTNEFRLSKDLFAGNTLTAGVYYAHSTDDDFWDLGNNLLLTFQNNASPLNVTVKGTDGKIYNVTHNGFASASFFQITQDWTGDNIATYLSDDWKINDKLSVDVGVRRELQKDEGQVSNDTTTNLSSNPLDLWGIGASVPCSSVAGGCAGGNFDTIQNTVQAFSWTAGANYYLEDDLAVYARASVGAHLPSFDDLRGAANGTVPQERAVVYEIGAKTATSWYSGSIDLYHQQFYATPTQLIVNNTVEFFETSTKGYGADFEGAIRPPFFPHFEVDVTGDYLHAKNDEGPTPATLSTNPALAAATAAAGDPFDGAAVARQPVFQSRVTPSYTYPFEWGSVKLFSTWTHSGPRYADFANSQPLPSYDTLDAGAIAYVGDAWDIRVTATNLTNSLALTEGAAQQTGTGVSNGVGIARPEFGRDVQLSATLHF
ncbi:MAG: TonB-dependent receptor [Aliidongia sp.]